MGKSNMFRAAKRLIFVHLPAFVIYHIDILCCNGFLVSM